MAHGEEDGFYSASVGRVVHLDVALADVADGDDGGGGLEGVQGFLEAVQAADFGEDEVMVLGEFVPFGEGLEEGCGIPVDSVHFLSEELRVKNEEFNSAAFGGKPL